MSGEPVIILPCFVNGCHWVTVVHREFNGRTLFFYADDLNQPATEQFVKNLLSQHAPTNFFPTTATWINCINYTYRLHSNECGPRSILAATILALHPNPSNTILLPAMHPNLAQILRTWLSCQIINQTIDHTALNELLHTSHAMTDQRTASSLPAYLFPWATSTTPQVIVGSDLRKPTKLSALAPIFIPKKVSATIAPTSQILHTASVHTVPLLSQKEITSNTSGLPSRKAACIGPAKRKHTVLPGQQLLTAFLSKPAPIPKALSGDDQLILSLSLPKSNLSQSSNTTTSNKQRQISIPISVPPQSVTTQRTLYDFAYFKPQSSITDVDPDIWGHIPEPIDTSTTFQILLQNPNGIRPSVTEPGFLFSLHISNEIGVGALCLTETNLNWHHSQHKFALRRCLHRNWQSSKFQTSVPDEIFLGNYQPGGTATIVVDRWTSRVLSSGMDPYGLGRWSYVTLRGKSDTSICIFTAYRVCNDRYTRSKTAYKQQKRQSSFIFTDQNKLVHIDPYKQCILDLQSWISSLQAQGTQIILCLDNNEELLPNKGQLIPLQQSDTPVIHPKHDGTLETLVRSTGLTDVLRHHHPSPTYPPTYNRGKKRIDLILVSTSLLPSITRSGILPYNSVFQGDHRPCYIDLDAAVAFGGQTSPVCPPCQRGLQLHDPRRVEEYLSTLHKQLLLHNIPTKVANLHAKASTGWEPSDYAEYEWLDTLITEAMLHAEKKTSKRYTKTYEWSPTLIKAVYAKRYWRLAYKRSTGRFVSDDFFTRTRTLAGIPFQPVTLQLPCILQCLSSAKETRKSL
jgi:hypothetical protein